MIKQKKFLMTSKMTMQKMIFKSEYANMQQYRQIVATTTTTITTDTQEIYKIS